LLSTIELTDFAIFLEFADRLFGSVRAGLSGDD
jgi:hypothetical protein